MGHSEMLLAVAGLSEKEVKQRTKKLADGDWSDFPAAERLAFKFAHKIASQPWAVGDADVGQLVKTFGRHRAVDIIWYCSWCNYMTRVADAFQLQLESKNVFTGRNRGAKKKARKDGQKSR
jgi:hypothetical protein